MFPRNPADIGHDGLGEREEERSCPGFKPGQIYAIHLKSDQADKKSSQKVMQMISQRFQAEETEIQFERDWQKRGVKHLVEEQIGIAIKEHPYSVLCGTVKA